MRAKIFICIKSVQKLLSKRSIGLPKKYTLYTLIRSPHIDKKSREQFAMKIHRTLLVFEGDITTLRDHFESLKYYALLGVQIRITFVYKIRL